MNKKVAVIGLGLIGGSIALELKKRFQWTVFGIDVSEENAKKALKIGIIDQIADFSVVENMDVVVIAVPVNHAPELALAVLDSVKNDALVFDVGSTKQNYKA